MLSFETRRENAERDYRKGVEPWIVAKRWGFSLEELKRELKIAKARGRSGGRRKKLNKEQVREVREMYQRGGWTQRKLADHPDLSQGTIHKIISGTYDGGG